MARAWRRRRSLNLRHVRENGPLAIHAPLTVSGQEDGFRATLCRCGTPVHTNRIATAVMPTIAVCGHGRAGDTQESQALAQRDGGLKIDPLRNGPLHVSGSLELVSGTGRTINRVSDTFLCRCGHSANKPYCDGSHVKTVFRLPD